MHAGNRFERWFVLITLYTGIVLIERGAPTWHHLIGAALLYMAVGVLMYKGKE